MIYLYSSGLPRDAGLLALYLILLLSPNLQPLNAQDRQIDDPDRAFEEARTLAFDGRYEASRRLARTVLESFPDYHDVRVLVARTYGWQGRYDEGYRELEKVLADEPDYRDAILARIDLEYWAGDLHQALELTEAASEEAVRDGELLHRRANLLVALERYDEAATVLSRLEALRTHPSRVRELRGRLAENRRRHSLQFYYTYDHYSETYAPWHMGSLRYRRATRNGPLLTHLNIASRFSQEAFQAVVEAYPQLGEWWYSHIEAAWSPESIFPRWRLGGELYRTFGSGWEASLGGRYLNFEIEDAVIITGSLTRYVGNWMISVRPYLAGREGGVSRAGHLLARRYFRTTDTHLTLRGGGGFTPEERQLLGPATGSVAFMRSGFGGMEYYQALGDNLQWMGEVRLTRQEMQPVDGYVTILTFVTGFSWRL